MACPEQIEQVRPRLVRFAGEMLADVPRSDQRAKGELYVRGLLTDGARKPMRPMAKRLGVDHQGLRQFVTSSTWDYEVVRASVAWWAAGVIDPAVYVVDDSGFPKDGTASPCVARQYSGTLDKTGNCQIGVSVRLATDHSSLAVNWRLFCPASWDDATIDDPVAAREVRQRRARVGIPEAVRHREKWRLALDMLDQVTGQWALPKLPVVGDSGYGDATESGWLWINVASTTCWRSIRPPVPTRAMPSRHAAVSRPGPSTRTRLPRPGHQPASLGTGGWARRAPPGYRAARRGTKRSAANPNAAMRSRFLAIRVRPANRSIPRDGGGGLPACWLIAEWPPGAAEPVKYWLSTWAPARR